MIAWIGIPLGLALGLAAGGALDNLLDVRMRWLPVLVFAFLARVVLDWLLGAGSVPDAARLWLVLLVYVPLTAMLLVNRGLPGVTVAALGTVANGLAIVANGGWMPVWQPSIAAAGFDPNVLHSNFHVMLTGPLDATFLMHGGPLADIIPIPLPPLQSVASIGDLLMSVGLAFFMFAAVVRAPVLVAVPVTPGGLTAGAVIARPSALAHPYVRLATNPPFTAMWLGQVISSLGDRIHQIALVYLVIRATASSPLALGLAFGAMTIPAVLVGPFAGTLVDRWDRKWVMVGSDLIRAAMVFTIPFAANLNIGLVLVLVFFIAVASTFFRPARSAALPQVVPDEDLLTANSAMWVADTVSDLAGYGLGGLFVAFLGSALTLAFWIDGASYLISAGLVAAVVIPRSARIADSFTNTIWGDLAWGWRYLRAETVLFATTVQATIAEYGLGALTALTPLLIAAVPLGNLDQPTAYGFFEMAMGAGLVGGGIALGAVAPRMPKGPAIVAGFAILGASLLLLAVTRNLALIFVFAAAVGIGNVTFVVPSQTVFQQRTPDELLGRVVAIRLAAVNAMLAVAMITSGVFAQVFGLTLVLLACGVITTGTGLAGLAVRAIREA